MGQSPAGTVPPAGFLARASVRAGAPFGRRPPRLEPPARRSEVRLDLVLEPVEVVAEPVQLVLDQPVSVADVVVSPRASNRGAAVSASSEPRAKREPHELTRLGRRGNETAIRRRRPRPGVPSPRRRNLAPAAPGTRCRARASSAPLTSRGRPPRAPRPGTRGRAPPALALALPVPARRRSAAALRAAPASPRRTRPRSRSASFPLLCGRSAPSRLG